MKITKSKLKQIIKEEMESILNEAKGPEWRGPGEEFIGPWAPPRSGHTGEVLPGGMEGVEEPDDIQILQAIKELLEASGRRVGTDGLARELQRLAEIVAKNPEFDVEEPEMSDVEPLELPPVTGASHRRMRQSAYRGKHGIK